MIKIGILSDTHGYIPDQVYTFFSECDELWHAGDIGMDVLERLQEFKPVVAVYGNTDTWELRRVVPETQFLRRENFNLFMTHIGGYPGHYEKRVKPHLDTLKPDIFIAGHSHILRVMYDDTYKLLHINPGAAGRQGIHKVSTLVRLTLDDKPKDLEICEIKR